MESGSRFFAFFKAVLGKRIYFVFILGALAAICDILGITILFPILEGILSNGLEKSDTIFPIFGQLPWIQTISLSTSILIMLLATFFLLKGIFQFLSLSYVAGLRGYILIKLKETMLDQVALSDFASIQERGAGYYGNIVNEQINRISHAFYCFSQLSLVGLNILFYIMLALIVAPTTLIFVSVTGGVLIILFRFLNSKMISSSNHTTNFNSKINDLFLQYFALQKYLRATNNQGYFRELLSAKAADLAKQQSLIGKLSAVTLSIRDPIAITFLLILITYQIDVKTNSVAESIVIIGILYRLVNSIFAVQSWWQGLLEYRGSVDIYQAETEKLRNLKKISSGSERLDKIGEISLNMVNYCFNDHDKILSDISCTISDRKWTAIIGKSGSGKSSLLSIVTGLYKPISGSIKFNGHNLENIELDKLRKTIGYITQDTPMLTGSLIQNIAFKTALSDDEKAKTAKLLNSVDLSDFARKIECGLDLDLGQNGSKLSGGQRQKIALVRELFRDPELLILDEATSAIDQGSEQTILELLRTLKDKITIIMVTHNIAATRFSDYIIALDKGRVIEQGTSESMLKNKRSFINELKVNYEN